MTIGTTWLRSSSRPGSTFGRSLGGSGIATQRRRSMCTRTSFRLRTAERPTSWVQYSTRSHSGFWRNWAGRDRIGAGALDRTSVWQSGQGRLGRCVALAWPAYLSKWEDVNSRSEVPKSDRARIIRVSLGVVLFGCVLACTGLCCCVRNAQRGVVEQPFSGMYPAC